MSSGFATFAAMAITTAGWFFECLAVVGTIYLVAATFGFKRFFASATAVAPRDDAVTLLKPLCGSEPQLEANLDSFLEQDHVGPCQLVCGVSHGEDESVAAVDGLQRRRPDADVSLVVDATRHGANAKVSNLVNTFARVRHAIVVISDSDIRVGRDYLGRLLAALDAPGVGAVSALYSGRGDAGFWSRVAAAGINHHFLPGAIFGVVTGIARPCMGSTIAMRTETLEAIGGLQAFGNTLADDYAIGEAVRRRGFDVAVPPLLVTHGSAERSFADVWRHELRWAATVRGVEPAGYFGSLIGLPVPLAVIALSFLAGASASAWYVLAAALVARVVVGRAVDRHVGYRAIPAWLIPLRDGLSLAVFIGGYFVRSVEWRGRRHGLALDGTLVHEAEYTG